MELWTMLLFTILFWMQAKLWTAVLMMPMVIRISVTVILMKMGFLTWLITVLQSPISGLVGTLEGIVREFVYTLQAIADKLPQIINIGPADENKINFMAVAQQMLGVKDTPLYSAEDMRAIRDKMNVIKARIEDRSRQIQELSAGPETKPKVLQATIEDLLPGEELMSEGIES